MFKSHVNLFSYIITIIIMITKWNYLNINLNCSHENEAFARIILIAAQE